jgi:hypothetical protein
VEHATAGDSNFQNAINGTAQQLMHAGLSIADAQKQALARFYGLVKAQAETLSYIDTYLVLAIAAGIMFLLSFTLQKTDLRGGTEAPMH